MSFAEASDAEGIVRMRWAGVVCGAVGIIDVLGIGNIFGSIGYGSGGHDIECGRLIDESSDSVEEISPTWRVGNRGRDGHLVVVVKGDHAGKVLHERGVFEGSGDVVLNVADG